MTPEQFKAEWIGERDRREAKNFDSVIATVREEARRAALEEAASISDEWANSTSCTEPHTNNPCCHVRLAKEISERIRMKMKPPRTLDDVLADLDRYVYPNEYRWLYDIARTAVEGLKIYEQQSSMKFVALTARPPEQYMCLNQTIRKLTEIR